MWWFYITDATAGGGNEPNQIELFLHLKCFSALPSPLLLDIINPGNGSMNIGANISSVTHLPFKACNYLGNATIMTTLQERPDMGQYHTKYSKLILTQVPLNIEG